MRAKLSGKLPIFEHWNAYIMQMENLISEYRQYSSTPALRTLISYFSAADIDTPPNRCISYLS